VPTRALIDANIFISYLLSPDSNGAIAGTVESLWRADLELVFPDVLASEIRTTIKRKPYLRERIALDDVDALIDGLRAIALPLKLEPIEIAPILRDRKDDYLLVEAVRSDADYLVSGDRDLLDIRDDIAHPRIVSPAEFITAISHP
jgi:putative PIN family toxin of toxin-antitoxin system